MTTGIVRGKSKPVPDRRVFYKHIAELTVFCRVSAGNLDAVPSLETVLEHEAAAVAGLFGVSEWKSEPNARVVRTNDYDFQIDGSTTAKLVSGDIYQAFHAIRISSLAKTGLTGFVLDKFRSVGYGVNANAPVLPEECFGKFD